jgi:hypothetical protein
MREEVTDMQFVRLLAAFVALVAPASAELGPSQCLAVAEAPSAPIRPVAGRIAALEEGQVRLTYVGHSVRGDTAAGSEGRGPARLLRPPLVHVDGPPA